MTTTFVPVESLRFSGGKADESKDFFQRASEHPCDGCPAPCCRRLIMPHPTPQTFLDLDYIRYMLGFPKITMLLRADGTWQTSIDVVCDLLDQETNRCTVHGTARQPKVCSYFNPYQCWYKRNFTTDQAPDVISIDRERFDALLADIRFDAHGRIVELPSAARIREIAHGAEQRA